MENFKKLAKKPLFLPIFCLILVLLINLIKSPDFFVIKVNNGVLFGRLIDIIKSSPDRVNPPCAVARQCGGCQIQHISYDKQLLLEKQQQL